MKLFHCSSIRELFDEFMNIFILKVFIFNAKLVGKINSGGRIINISTGTTRFSNPVILFMLPWRGAVEVFTRYLAKLREKILEQTLLHSPVETMNFVVLPSVAWKWKDYPVYLHSNRCWGTADDIGSVVAFLCTDDAKWINGQRIEVSGGINI